MKSDCLPTKDMQTSPPLLRTDHLDIKDAKCAKDKDGRKVSYRIISRLGVAGIQKGHFGSSKIQLSSIVAKFAG